MRAPRPCIICGKSFAPVRGDTLCCGPACSRKRAGEMQRKRADDLASTWSQSGYLAKERDRGITVEEWLEERRPAWAREPGPRADAWSGYSSWEGLDAI